MVRLLVALAIAAAGVAPAAAQAPSAQPAPPAREETREAEIIRARLLSRLGRTEEALAAFGILLAKYPDDQALRADHVEFLLDSGFTDRAEGELGRLLLSDPRSARVRRLQARLELERGAPSRAADILAALVEESPDDLGLRADLASARVAAGRWAQALSIYSDLLERSPDHDDWRAAHRDLLAGYSPRLQYSHLSLYQQQASHHVDEFTWKAWVAQQWWVRAGTRYGHYHQQASSGEPAFNEYIVTPLVEVGFQATRRLLLRAGLEEPIRHETAQTTLRLGGAFDDGRLLTLTLDAAVHEIVTNPVVAIPLRGTRDRATLDLSRRLTDRAVVFAHYEYRNYRASGEELGHTWEGGGRAEVALWHEHPLQVTLAPQLFFEEYTPVAGSPLREQIGFIRRRDMLGMGLLIGWEVLQGLRVQVGSTGHRDLHRQVSSWEALGEVRWRIRRWVEMRVLYNRNTDGGLLGGTEQLFTANLEILY
ncbi:MAG TPA: tetratricopeptide repeat protein [Methylomirabilota bacterium]|nr:tetratricopeptide repeat protein [Methylomirabilota bacterium]